MEPWVTDAKQVEFGLVPCWTQTHTHIYRLDPDPNWVWTWNLYMCSAQSMINFLPSQSLQYAPMNWELINKKNKRASMNWHSPQVRHSPHFDIHPTTLTNYVDTLVTPFVFTFDIQS